MMGRIVFLHFLQKKGWLNGNLVFLRDLFFFSPHQDDFLEQVLEPLFFGIFNTEPGQRRRLFEAEGWDLGLLEQWQTLPYLNGGLFERDAVDALDIRLPASVFDKLFTFLASYNFTVDENDPDDAEVGVDPEMLGKIFESLLENNKINGSYYTPKEIVRYMCKESLIAYLDSKLESNGASAEVSERLNARSANNPTQGTQCGVTESRSDSVPEVRDLKAAIRAFVEHHEMQPELEPYRDTLDTALRNVKICDPAIGSGAFPMGLLNELWRCREALQDTSVRFTIDAKHTTDTSERSAIDSQHAANTSKRCDLSNTVQADLDGVATEREQRPNLCSAVTSVGSPLRAGGTRPQTRVELKKQIIENNIYGVDIDQGAIDIARLRFWLSIVVDAEEPEPLPNFDYKFMQGNSLIESYKGIDLSRISNRLRGGQSKSTQLLLGLDSDFSKKNLQRLMRDYFSVTDHKQKASMRQAINDEVKHLITDFIGGTASDLDNLDPSANQDFFLWHTWFKDIFDNGGFDIVIANPPYGAKYDETTKHYYKSNYSTAKTIRGIQKGSLDTFTLFIERGFVFLKEKGSFAYITPMSLTSSDSLTGVHNILMKKCDNIYISSYAVRPEPVFKNACIDVSILLFRKAGNACKHIFSTTMYRKKKGMNINLQKLVDNLHYIDVNGLILYGRIPKIGTEIEKNILQKVFLHNKIKNSFHQNGTPIYYRVSGGRYFKVVTNYPTGSTKEKPIFLKDNIANAIGCILSSNLSFWFYQIYSNNHDWKSYELENFTIPNMSNENISYLNNLYSRYLDDIERNANVRISSGQSSYIVDSFKEYKIVRSKAIIDEIDDYIGPLYGLTQEEVDFIKNYELEFRMAGE